MEKGKAALLVVDVQKEFYEDERSKESLKDALLYINHTIDIFERAGQPVIYIQDEDAGGGIDTEGFQLCEGLKVLDNCIRLTKSQCNSFWNTELEEKLKALDIKLVAICGYAAEYCITATYNGAMERGFKPVLLQHGIASGRPQYAAYVQDIFRTASYAVFEQFI